MVSAPDDHAARGNDVSEPSVENLDNEFYGFVSKETQDYYKSLFIHGHFIPQIKGAHGCKKWSKI